VVACVAFACAGAGIAFADAGTATDPNEKRIPKDFDIFAVGQGHTGDGQLAHLVRVMGRYTAPFPNSSQHPYLTIDPEDPGGDVYTVQMYDDGTSDVTLGFEQTGPAIFKKTDKRTLQVEFPPSAIGDPSSYTWRVQYSRTGPDDRAPNKGMYSHRLR
jgi:hypothetical protein